MTTTMPKRPARRPLDPHPLTDPYLPGLKRRLREAREKFQGEPVSLRRFAEILQQKAYPIDWHSVQRYEGGDGSQSMRIPADYVLAVALVTKAPAGWLLAGEGSDPWG